MLLLAACTGAHERPYGYLAAHTMADNYGRLFYSLADKNLKFRLLNQGKPVHREFIGHAGITRGRDGVFLMVGIDRDQPGAIIYASRDLINWDTLSRIQADRFDIGGSHYADRRYLGAPKLFYDQTNDLYTITWHASSVRVDPKRKPDNTFWLAMKSFYMQSRDLNQFTPGKRLFPWEFPTIDAHIVKDDLDFYVFFKDVRFPSEKNAWGKGVRGVRARDIGGPYDGDSTPVSPGYREAPSVEKHADGYLMIYEHYPAIKYEMQAANSLAGPWQPMPENTYSFPPSIRHASLTGLSETEYQRIHEYFSEAPSRTQEQ